MSEIDYGIISYDLLKLPKKAVSRRTTLGFNLDVTNESLENIVRNELNLLNEDMVMKTFTIKFDEDDKNRVYAETEVTDGLGAPIINERVLDWTWDEAKQTVKQFVKSVTANFAYSISISEDYSICAEKKVISSKSTLSGTETKVHILFNKAKMLPEIAEQVLVETIGKESLGQKNFYRDNIAEAKIKQFKGI